MKKISCPNGCIPVKIQVGEFEATLVHYPQILDKNGVNTNPDGNITTFTCTCLVCGHRWEEEVKRRG